MESDSSFLAGCCVRIISETAALLGGQWNIDEECAGRFRIVTGDDGICLVLAARPRSASRISPGLAFIEGIEDFLHVDP